MSNEKFKTIPPPPEQPKKVVRRRTALALGIICILLVVGLGGAMAYYVSNHSHTNSDYNSLMTKINELNNTLIDLNNTLNLGKSTVWVNDQTVSQANGAYSYYYEPANYTGYVVVTVESSTVPGTWIMLSYSSHGLYYDQAYTETQAINVGNSAEFPVLPASLTIGVGNGLVFGSGATETVTITYYY
jgi:hypothetical protein